MPSFTDYSFYNYIALVNCIDAHTIEDSFGKATIALILLSPFMSIMTTNHIISYFVRVQIPDIAVYEIKKLSELKWGLYINYTIYIAIGFNRLIFSSNLI